MYRARSASGGNRSQTVGVSNRNTDKASQSVPPAKTPADKESATHAIEVRKLLRRFRAGVLGTHSRQYDGYPYGAAVPFCTDHEGRIVTLISHLAEHTRNIEQDAHVCFTVSALHETLQTQARATVLGDIAANADKALARRYLRFFPESRQYLEIGGFHFHSIEPRHVRLIAGFGSLHWISGAAMLSGTLPIAQAEESILEHMNQDHHRNLMDYCRHCHNITPHNVQMIGIDCDGFDLRADDNIYRVDFESGICDAQDARAALATLARIARN